MKRNVVLVFAVCLLSAGWLYSCKTSEADNKPRRLEILFLGHKSEHHDSEKLAGILSREYFKKGINITYTTNPDDMLREDFKLYDGLILYANHDSITPAQEKALLNYVRSGKGFIPLHCASWCFRNSPEIVELTGGQFKTHQSDSFKAVILKPDHPVMKNVPAFTTADETYVHDKLSKNIEVLTERVEGDHHEPYTWVRTYDKGRVFYTAYGHDEHTWNNPGFQQLVYNGIMWAVGDHARSLVDAYPKPEPEYTEAIIPNYERRNPPPRLQAPLTPEESMELIQVPVGFKLELFAAEPHIHKPIHMNWDEKGRLWVAETVDYPNMVRENKKEGRDMIKILEDTDGDGKADKFTVFADGLNIPTGFAFINGGIVVSQAPDFLFLKDTNGDDKADVREKIITGWGTFDTHAGPSNLRYGPDNTIWGTVGYSGFKGVVGNNPDTMQFGQGLYHFTADGKQLEFLGATSNNTWGLGFSEDFDVFVSTANNTHSASYTIPKRYFDMAGERGETGIEKTESHYSMHVVTKNLRQVDVHGGFTAAAGHSLYTARYYPKEYWNRIAFVCEPTGRVIHKNIIERNGASFKEGEDGWNFIASADEWFGPVQADVGPDGNVWILDWYNFIIQHNPTPEGFENGKGNAYINALRDSAKGRIYRIVYKKGESKSIKSLDKQNADQLVKALSNDNMFWRTTAQRLLVESGDKKVLSKLYAVVENEKTDVLGLSPGAIHALWTMQGMHALKGEDKQSLEVAIKALKHPSAGVRRAAIQVLPVTDLTVKALLESGVFEDADLRVVLAAILKTCDLPASDEIGHKLFKLANKDGKATEDKWIQKALAIASDIQHTGFEKASKTSGASIESEKIDLGKADKVIVLKTIPNEMKYDKPQLTAKAGSILEIVFTNADFMQHNLLILKPGSSEKVGAAADKLAQAPGGGSMQYIPALPEVLYATPLVNPDQKFSLKFRVPDLPGEYPFLCSYPGHWRIMNGVLTVTK